MHILESLYIPASVKSIAVVAFPEYKISRDIVPNFSFIDVDSENEVYTSMICTQNSGHITL